MKLSINKKYDASIPKDDMHEKLYINWELREYAWEEDPIVKLVSSQGISGNNWPSGHKGSDDWVSTEALILDFDKGTPNLEALLLEQKAWGFDSYISSSNNHQKETVDKNTKKIIPACDKLHVLIPLAYPCDCPLEMKDIGNYWIKLITEKYGLDVKGQSYIDKSCFDLHRYFYHSSKVVSSFVSGRGPLKWKEMPGYEKSKLESKKTLDMPEFSINWEVECSDGTTIKIKDIKQKTKINCPMCKTVYKRKRASTVANASIRINDKGFLSLYCSSCESEGLGVKGSGVFNPDTEEMLKDYWYVESKIVNIGFSGEYFSVADTSVPLMKSQVGMDFVNKRRAGEILSSFRKNKLIRHLDQVNYVSDASANVNNYVVEEGKGTITVNYKHVDVNIKDNAFWEDYLNNTFCDSATTMKEWLAVFFNSNYKELPTMILTGQRGTGKSKFAEVVGSAYPSLTTAWGGSEGNFNDEVEKKLLIVEENAGDCKNQYKTLKSYSGSGAVKVNKKFIAPYMVNNNMNIIILSNNPLAVFAEKRELPTTPDENQFFVYEMQPLKNRDVNIKKKLVDRLGHYIDTELKDLYDNMPTNNYRYQISVPITDAEKRIFAGSTTKTSSGVDAFLNYIEDYVADQEILKYLKAGKVCTEFVSDSARNVGIGKTTLYNALVGLNYLDKDNDSRGKQLGKVKRKRYYVAGKATIKFVKENYDG